MHIKKAKYHLERIETILHLHDDGLSALDRDILLEDIRHLYDAVLNAGHGYPSPPSPTPRDHTYVSPAPKPLEQTSLPREEKSSESTRHIHSTPVNEKSNVPQVRQEERYIPTVKAEPIPPPDLSDKTSDHIPTTVTYEHSGSSEDKYEETNHHPPSTVHPVNGHSSGTGNQISVADEGTEVLVREEVKEYPELFEFKSTSDLSDKLASSKIEHLNKILTINDKILFINHLFKGEAIPFQETLQKFESFYTYEEAKKYASEELVEQLNWTAESKKETIRQFMRQVKRLY